MRRLDSGSGKKPHAYLWAYRSGVHDDGPPIVVFDYQTSRAGAHARAFLHVWRGYLMVDYYAGYKAMLVDGATELACLAHIRRKFSDVHAAGGSPIAEQALHLIAKLYAIEQQCAGLDPPRRLLLREQLALPGWPNGLPGSSRASSPARRPWLEHFPLTLTVEGMKSAWRRVRVTADMPHVNFHDLRHSCASILVGLGVYLYTISKVLWHSSVQSTQRYAHLQVEAQRAALQKIGELLDRTPW